MTGEKSYDLAVAGGGLAGLALAIQVAEQGFNVILFEKEKYPFHRVCGEYISMESWDFLEELGIDLEELHVPEIKKLQISGMNGRSIQQRLPLGGFGISRYLLDAKMAVIAREKGVQLLEETKVNDIRFAGDSFTIESSGGIFQSKLAACCYGKRSNLDIKWKRPFSTAAKNKLNNFIGVKYHVRANYPPDSIALHIFKNGYCGISKVENDTYCLCYLTTAANLQQCNNDIGRMERDVLSRNPHLKKIFKQSEKLWKEPVIISQISFDKKTQVEDHILMAGDAAGMITPLCGNGMSMALHGSKLAAKQVFKFLTNDSSRDEMEKAYSKEWKKAFSGRLRTGRMIQRLFGHPVLTGLLISIGKIFPALIKMLIRKTHGRPF